MVLIVFLFVFLTIFSVDSSISEATSRVTLHEPSSIADFFHQWTIQFSRVYNNESEKQMRFEVFKKNLKYIEDFNSKGNQTYRLGVNEFTDMTDEEFFATYTSHMTDINMTSTPEVADEIIPSPNRNLYYKDWRTKGAVTPVKLQGGCGKFFIILGLGSPIRDLFRNNEAIDIGSCWAFSAIAVVESLTKINRRNLLRLSEQQLIDCDRSRHNKGCKGGNMPEAFYYIAQNGGIASESEYPYRFQEGICKTNVRPSMQIRGFRFVPKNNEKALIVAVERQPVSININAENVNFIRYAGGVYDEPYCGLTVTHAVTLVGYGTSRQGIKYWLAKNFWGKYWGEKGYSRLRRDVEWPEGTCGLAQWPSYPVA